MKQGVISLIFSALAAFFLLTDGFVHSQEVPILPGKPLGQPNQTPIDRNPNRQKTGDQLVKVTASPTVSRIAAGQKFTLAFVFEIEPGWHIYWENSGASGGPTTVHVSAPQGFEVGKLLFPRPKVLHGEEGETYGYEDKTVLFVEMTAPPQQLPTTAMVSAHIRWMVCKDICLLGQSRLTVNLPVGSSLPGPGSSSSSDPAVSEHQKRLPSELSKLASAEATHEGGNLIVKLPAKGRTTAEFFPIETPGVTYGAALIDVHEQVISITVPVTVNPNNSLGEKQMIRAVVGLGNQQNEPCYQLEIPLPAS